MFLVWNFQKNCACLSPALIVNAVGVQKAHEVTQGTWNAELGLGHDQLVL